MLHVPLQCTAACSGYLWHGYWCDGQVQQGLRILAGKPATVKVLFVNFHRGFTVRLLQLCELLQSHRGQPFLDLGRSLCEFSALDFSVTSSANFAVDLECALLYYGCLCTLADFNLLEYWHFDVSLDAITLELHHCICTTGNLRHNRHLFHSSSKTSLSQRVAMLAANHSRTLR